MYSSLNAIIATHLLTNERRGWSIEDMRFQGDIDELAV